MEVVASKGMKKYFEEIDKKVRLAYSIAKKARSKGYDPEEDIAVPLAKNMAERVEGLISTVSPGIACGSPVGPTASSTKGTSSGSGKPRCVTIPTTTHRPPRPCGRPVGTRPSSVSPKMAARPRPLHTPGSVRGLANTAHDAEHYPRRWSRGRDRSTRPGPFAASRTRSHRATGGRCPGQGPVRGSDGRGTAYYRARLGWTASAGGEWVVRR